MGTVYRKQKALYTNEEFKQLDLRFRVGAILSDGQWYTSDKIRQWSKERNLDEINPILNEMMHQHQIIKSNNGASYRMSLRQMQQWRHDQHMSMDAQPIPKLLYPRVFGQGDHAMSEVELFESAPLHQVAILTFMLKNPDDIDKLKKDLGYLGRFRKSPTSGKYQLYALSNKVTKDALLKWEDSHGGDIFVPGKFNSNNSSRRRELIELDRHVVNELITFYIQFSKYLVPSIKKTFNVYLNGSIGASASQRETTDSISEGDSIIMQWLLSLIKTYDEGRCVPFSYSIVMLFPRKAYDYSSKIIGDDLNRFQLEKNRAIKRLNEQSKAQGSLNSMKHIENSVICNEINKNGSIDLSIHEYEDLDMSLKSWQKSYSQESLDWTETGEERGFVSKNDESFLEGIASRSDIHHAIILAAEDTHDWSSEVIMFNALTDSSIASAMMKGKMDLISDSFRDALATSLAEVRRLG